MEDVPHDRSSSFARFAASTAAYAKKTVREYVFEFKSTDESRTQERIRAAEQISEFVIHHPVALLVHPAQVSVQCNQARALIACALPPGQVGEMDVFDHETAALKMFLGVHFQGLPAVYIKGECIGGLDELQGLLGDSELFQEKLRREYENMPMIDHDKLAVKRQPLGLLHQAGGGPWYCFHLYTYGNVIRMISLIHVFLAVICCILISQDAYTAAEGVATYIFFDCLLLIAGGPSPWSPTGTLSTVLVWPRRGPTVTVLPYKVIFAFYAVLMGRLAMRSSPFGSDSASQHFDSQSEFITIAINSTLLAVLRF